jgi:hypothetical protein
MFCIEKPGKNRLPQKKNKLTTAEILTLWIFRYFSWIDTWKKYYNFLKTYHSSDFPNLLNYQNFIKW